MYFYSKNSLYKVKTASHKPSTHAGEWVFNLHLIMLFVDSYKDDFGSVLMTVYNKTYQMFFRITASL